ncbi:MAG: prepilin-type N-terminal cleavage/methylation domain-containing protein [Ruminococcus sp.]|nr:prepilin-type N-terminal cleavage/methylation domain-containing protein [Ruminococcus sp.]
MENMDNLKELRQEKKSRLKGFTLMELIIVMAVFSILLVGVLQLVDPVNTIFRSASVSEKTYSMSNNIDVYLKSKLEYAEGCWIYTSDQMSGTSEADLAAIAESYRNHLFANMVTYDSSVSAATEAKFNMYIMRLVNTPGGTIPQGQITLRTIADHGASSAISDTDIPAEVAQLNTAYFDPNVSDSQYNISYALGNSSIMVPNTGMADAYSFKALQADYDDSAISMTSFTDLTVTVAIEKALTSSEISAGLHTNGIYSYVDGGGNTVSYRAFKNPCSLSVCSIPLMNISFNNGYANAHYFNEGGTIKITDGIQKSAISAFDFSNTYATPDFTSDIYFFFSYADEIS